MRRLSSKEAPARKRESSDLDESAYAAPRKTKRRKASAIGEPRGSLVKVYVTLGLGRKK